MVMPTAEAAAAARQELLERERQDVVEARWCRCARPVPSGTYLGYRACRACGLLLRKPIRVRL